MPFPRVRLIRSDENLGFGRGQRGRCRGDRDFLVLVDPDGSAAGAVDHLMAFAWTIPSSSSAAGDGSAGRRTRPAVLLGGAEP